MSKPVELRPAKFSEKDWPLKAEIKSKHSVFSKKPEGCSIVDDGNRLNVAAIDFGTTHCSLAYTTENSEAIVTLFLNEIFPRVPTAILLCKESDKVTTNGERLGINCKVHAFGRNAQAQYQRIRPGDRKKYIYFERMKMQLQHDQVKLYPCHDYNR